jgi:hypothetical protein
MRFTVPDVSQILFATLPFGLFMRSFRDSRQAQDEWESLERFETERNEELGKALLSGGWRQLVPQAER